MWVAFFLLAVCSTSIATRPASRDLLKIPFVYMAKDATLPKYVGYLREALGKLKLNVKNIKPLSFEEKWELHRMKYKATYEDRLGQKCTIKWAVGAMGSGVQMPVCQDQNTSVNKE